MLGQQRRIVVTQLRTEPGQSADRALRLDRELENEQNLFIGRTADHNGRYRPPPHPNVALPMDEPLKRLENGVVGLLLEAFPLRADFVQVIMNGESNAGLHTPWGGLFPHPGKRGAYKQWKLSLAARRRRWAEVECEAVGCASGGVRQTAGLPNSNAAWKHGDAHATEDYPDYPMDVCNHS